MEPSLHEWKWKEYRYWTKRDIFLLVVLPVYGWIVLSGWDEVAINNGINFMLIPYIFVICFFRCSIVIEERLGFGINPPK